MLRKLSYFIIPALLLYFFSCVSEEKAPSSNLPDEGMLNINGADVYYKTMGEGEPILFVHGGPGLDHSYFLPQMEALSKEYQLIFYDQRACGKSSANVDSSQVSLAGFVEDIDSLRQRLGLDKIHLLAHSWGSVVGVNYAAKHQENLKSLILLNPSSPNNQLQVKGDSLAATMQTPEDKAEMAEIMQSPAFAERKAEAFQDLFRVVFRKDFVEKTYADSLTLTFPETFAQNSQVLRYLGKDLASFDLFPLMSQISIPTLLIYGDKDPMASLAGDAIHEAFPNAQYELIEECGHFPFIEKQEEFIQLIQGFVKP